MVECIAPRLALAKTSKGAPVSGSRPTVTANSCPCQSVENQTDGRRSGRRVRVIGNPPSRLRQRP